MLRDGTAQETRNKNEQDRELGRALEACAAKAVPRPRAAP